MRWWPVILALGSLPGCVSPMSDSGLPGNYRLTEGPDVAGRLAISADGRFRYDLAAGALDEAAEGRWEGNGSAICLFTEPRPVPPVFSRVTGEQGEDRAQTLLVTWPDGSGIAGVDFRIGLDDGSVIADYTQYDGWTMPPNETRKPVWVELAVPMHGLKSPRFALDGQDRGPWRFVLTPNDLGIVDFQGECLRREGNGYVLDREGGTMHFAKVER